MPPPNAVDLDDCDTCVQPAPAAPVKMPSDPLTTEATTACHCNTCRPGTRTGSGSMSEDSIAAIGSSGSGATEEDQMDGTSTCASVAAMVCSIPALVGSCCWPLLLAGLFPTLLSGLNTAGTRALTHSLTWGLNFALFTNMLQFMKRKVELHPKRSQYAHFRMYAPCYLLALAGCLVLVDLTRHILNDAFGMECEDAPKGAKFDKMCDETGFATMYTDDGGYTTVGLLGIICTWTGFLCMYIAIFWGIDLFKKFKNRWNRIRGARHGETRATPLLNQA